MAGPRANSFYRFRLATATPFLWLSYSPNVNDGPSFTTIHQGTELLLSQDNFLFAGVVVFLSSLVSTPHTHK
jgi:hypothetical protein